jgi:DNA-binding NtrC family response regulator
VLVVEDHFLTRWSVAEYLRRVGFQVIEAISVPEAKSVLSAGTRVDVVFSDVNMPGGEDGYLLAQWISEHHPNLPVLLTSGGPEDCAAYTQGALRHFMPKPYEPDAIVARLRAMLGECGGRVS